VAKRQVLLTFKMMWGGGLFLLTIVLIVPTGRTAIEAYTELAMTRLAAQSPFSEIVFASILVVALLLFLLMRQGKPEQPKVYVIKREMRGLSAADLEIHFPQGSRTSAAKFMPILQPSAAGGAPKRPYVGAGATTTP
jgi:hypothetical protein